MQGKFAGNAAGFKISSLTKLMDTRANKPRVTLLHYLVNEVIKKNKDALDFVVELSPKLDVLNRYLYYKYSKIGTPKITTVTLRKIKQCGFSI